MCVCVWGRERDRMHGRRSYYLLSTHSEKGRNIQGKWNREREREKKRMNKTKENRTGKEEDIVLSST